MMHTSSPASVLTNRSGRGIPTGVGESHAKAILFGEHTVVYGAPAIAFPLPELLAQAHVRQTGAGIRIDSDLFDGRSPHRLEPVLTAGRAALDRLGQTGGAFIRIRSNIPPGRGLGSSAAVAAAVARAVADTVGTPLVPDVCYEVVQKAERRAHGTPSGLDARAVISDGVIDFQRGEVNPIDVAEPLTFVLADSGVEGATAYAVAAVHARRETDLTAIDRVINRLAMLAEEASKALNVGDLRGIGTRMSEAHTLLDQLGVSTPMLDTLVAAAQSAGSLGAKLTGGGLGGCVIALATSTDDVEPLRTAMRAAGAPRTWTATVRNT